MSKTLEYLTEKVDRRGESSILKPEVHVDICGLGGQWWPCRCPRRMLGCCLCSVLPTGHVVVRSLCCCQGLWIQVSMPVLKQKALFISVVCTATREQSVACANTPETMWMSVIPAPTVCEGQRSFFCSVINDGKEKGDIESFCDNLSPSPHPPPHPTPQQEMVVIRMQKCSFPQLRTSGVWRRSGQGHNATQFSLMGRSLRV